ncbi:type II secretion system protein GspD [Rheinheimera marina]|uniref:Type II secretion system protein GspD n=1 Tax=Rheinheimera marina TaxID=1774958 RepID=A0ABV9JRE7_9GAMM
MKQSFYLSLLACAVLSGCAIQPAERNFELQSSYLRTSGAEQISKPSGLTDVSVQEERGAQGNSFHSLSSIQRSDRRFISDSALASRFSASPELSIAAENMPLADFLHHVFGELLGANYVLGEGLTESTSTISLNVQEKISKQKLFTMAEALLLQRKIVIKRQNELLYIYQQPVNAPDLTEVGYGRTPDTVPNAVNVKQIVPLKYVVNTSALDTLRQIANVQTGYDSVQGLLFLTGEQQQVLRALELLQLLDAPGSRGRNIAFLKLKFLNAEEYIKVMKDVLINEGILSADERDSRVGFVPIAQIGAVAVFASDADFIKRVQYWTEQLDQPSMGTKQQYFVYAPRYARASDLGQSVSTLISGQSTARQSQAQNATEQRTAEVENRSATTSTSAENENVRMVVDERSNTLIFYTSGSDYQALLPLIERLDVMPKQVMLELTIAEVTLTDEFKYGVDAAFNSGRFSGSTSFGAADIGGAVLGWASGSKTINAQAFETNSLVNVLSKPTILVRDGVAATINVGTDIPIVGKTTTDPTTGTTRSVDYRKTGIDVSVTPTINAQGVVIMSIDQSNSNQVAGGATLEGNPQIFERSLKTEVVAESGQTIVLGGLISENKSNNDDGVPFLHRIPVLGALFGTKNRTNNKTELVILVTPKVIERPTEWLEIRQKLNEGLQFINLDE